MRSAEKAWWCGALLAAAFYIGACSALMAAQEEEAARPVQIRLGDQYQYKPVQRLDLGNVLEGTSQTIVLGVKNCTATPLELALFSEGSRVSAKWVTDLPPSSLPKNLRVLDADQEAQVSITFNAASDLANDLQMLALSYRSELLCQIILDYSLRSAETVSVTVLSGWLPSPVGSGLNNPEYKICSGPAPDGYEYERNHFFLQGPPDHDRHCGTEHPSAEGGDGRWSKCHPLVRSSEDVCWGFQFQGHEKEGNKSKVDAMGKLTVWYRLRRSEPKLD